MTFKLSKDYARLIELLLAGQRIHAILNYQNVCRDVCEISQNEEDGSVQFAVRGIVYFQLWRDELETHFYQKCQERDVEFYAPIDEESSLKSLGENTRKGAVIGALIGSFFD